MTLFWLIYNPRYQFYILSLSAETVACLLGDFLQSYFCCSYKQLKHKQSDLYGLLLKEITLCLIVAAFYPKSYTWDVLLMALWICLYFFFLFNYFVPIKLLMPYLVKDFRKAKIRVRDVDSSEVSFILQWRDWSFFK